MELSDDITIWINNLKLGDQEAAAGLWRVYFERLTRIARHRIAEGAARQADEEDAALSAMYTFYRGMQAGRYENLQGRDELWRLLVTIVHRKIAHERRRQLALKRGGNMTLGESVFMNSESPSDVRGIEHLLSEEPTPDLVAMLAENSLVLLNQLSDDALRRIAQLKLEGYSNEEIANRLECTVRSVERKLNRIRSEWANTNPIFDHS